MDWNKLYVVEYSVSQECFHVHQMEDMLQKNMKSMMDKRAGDYLPIAVFNTEQDAGTFVELIRDTVKFSIVDRIINKSLE